MPERVTRSCFRSVTLAALLGLAFALGCAQRSEPEQRQAQAADRTYLSACARCHGSDGLGGIASPEGSHPPRNFHDTAFQTSRSDEQLKNVIRNGKGGMPAFGKLFSDTELQSLVRQIRSFAPGIKKP